MSKKTKINNIALLYGGSSSEREVSLNTGKNIGSELEDKGYRVTYIDTANKEEIKQLEKSKFEIAFLALHGKGGEDGTIQGFLETLGIPYTGSGVYSSATAINKAYTKQIYENNIFCKLPTSPYFIINKNFEYNVDDIVKKLGEKCVIKAASEGSSIGLFQAKTKEEINKYIKEALAIEDEVVVEKFIEGREFTIPTFKLPLKYKENKELELFYNECFSFPIIEIIPKNEFYDFSSKYDQGGSVHVCPAEISDNITLKMKKYAAAAHMALGCDGVTRTDMMVDENNNIWLLETNTLPGMTSTSLVPDSAKHAGISFGDICELLIMDAVNK